MQPKLTVLGSQKVTVSICVATYRRPERLALLLADVVAQHRKPDEVVVVDNDAEASARPVIARQLEIGAPCPIHYEVQPVRNISVTRNRTVSIARGEWLAFVDDDERAPQEWLGRMLDAASTSCADGILGPVHPEVPQSAPRWIRRGRFYDFPRMPSGTLIPRNRLRFGNVLVRGSLLRATAQPFDPALGLTGGEDGDLLSKLAQQGAQFVWCDEACVWEPVEADRLSLAWLMKRALRGGQNFATHALAGRYGRMPLYARVAFFLRALLQALTSALLALFAWPLGRHWAAYWLTKLCANVGKMTAFWRWRYREYA